MEIEPVGICASRLQINGRTVNRILSEAGNSFPQNSILLVFMFMKNVYFYSLLGAHMSQKEGGRKNNCRERGWASGREKNHVGNTHKGPLGDGVWV